MTPVDVAQPNELADAFTGGVPVEIGRIDRELKKLWEQSGGAMTRASLINLAVYSEAPNALATNTEIVSRITEDHACRAIVIAANPAAAEARAQAWISAHCHVSKAGAKQVCSEQLSFLIDGHDMTLLPNIVFSQLDSDLPFYLWWQAEFHDPMDPQLWAWVDRVIFDSQSWSDFGAQLQRVQTAQAEAKQRIVLCDLNWTRIVQLRLAIAQFFDHPASHHHFLKMNRLEIDHAPECRSTAVLLAGWLASQLDWHIKATNGSDSLQFRRGKLGETAVKVKLNAKDGEPISRVVIGSDKIEFRVVHETGSDLLNVSRGAAGEECIQHRLPAGKNDPVSLMSEELMRGGPHRVYLRAIERVRSLL
jgi:glucose-6-phosphate dehydrogenase assembly protein OpcA